MTQIITADIDAFDPTAGSLTLRYATQSFVDADAGSVEPTIDSRITVSRAGVATRTNRNGVIESVAANVARFDYDAGVIARSNLLLYSERFDLIWTRNTGVTSTANAAAAPDGSVTAELVREGTTNNRHWTAQSLTVNANTAYTFSIYAKAATRNFVGVVFGKSGSPFTRAGSIVNLSDGSITTYNNNSPTSVVRHAAQNVGNGWWRISITVIIDATSTDGYAEVWPSNAAGVLSYLGDGTSGVYVWGAQLEQGTKAGQYVSTSNARGIVYRPTLRGLLVEEPRTNYLFRSADFSTTWSTSTLGSVSVSQPGGQTAPDGSSAWKLVTNDTASGPHALFQSWSGGIVSTGYCWSVYVKAAEYTRASVYLSNTAFASTTYGGLFDLSTGVVLATANGSTVNIQPVGNGWYRCSVTATSDADGGNYVAVVRFVPSTVSTVDGTFTPSSTGLGGWVWGAQVEIGSFPTSYIPTTSAAVTRNADDISLTGTNFSSWYNSTQGTMYVEASQPTIFGVTRWAASLATTSNAPRISLYRQFSGLINAYVLNAAAASSILTSNLQASSNVPFRSAIGYSGSAQSFSANGTAASTATIDLTSSTLTALAIGRDYIGGTEYWNGHIRSIRYWSNRLSDNQLAALTSGQSIPSGDILDLDFSGSATAFYEGRIQQAANVQRSMFSPNSTSGRSQIGFGNLVLANNDGGLDGLLNYSFAGRSITIRLGEVLPNGDGTPAWTTVLKGTMEQAEFSWQRVVVRVRDRQQDLAKPLQQTRFAGTNALPAGLEGVATDIKGKPKPIVFGQVFNAQLPQVNSTRLIFQAHDGLLQSVDAVYDRGVTLTAGAAYASQVDMETNAPAAGQYRVWNTSAGCYIRLGSNPSGVVTADLTQGAAASNRTAAQLFSAILARAGVVDVNAADITALDAAVSYPLGLFCSTYNDTSALQACDIVMQSVGAWFGSDSTGVMRCGRLELPTGASVGTINATDVISVERVSSKDPGVGIPAWKVKLGYQRIWEVQNDLASGVTADRKEYLANEYRRTEASDSAVLTVNATSPEIEFLTTLVSATDAAAEASRRLTIYKTRRDMLEVRVRVDAALAAALDIGKIVTLQLNRYGLSAGKKFLIIGLRTDMRNRMFDLTLWG